MQKPFCKCPNNGLFIVALVFLVVFLLSELILRMYDLYFHEPLVDVPSHFFAGMAVAAGALWVATLNRYRRPRSVAVLVTFGVSVIWEVLETMQELVIENPPHLQDIFFWDGFFDIIVTVLGGAFSFLFIAVVKKKTALLDDAVF